MLRCWMAAAGLSPIEGLVIPGIEMITVGKLYGGRNPELAQFGAWRQPVADPAARLHHSTSACSRPVLVFVEKHQQTL